MKLLLLNDYSTPGSGHELTFLTIRSEFIKRGWEVRFMSTDAQPITSKPLADKLIWGYFKSDNTQSFWNEDAAIETRFECDRFKPDVALCGLIETQLSPSVLYALHSKKVPIVVYPSAYEPISTNGFYRYPLPIESTPVESKLRLNIEQTLLKTFNIPIVTTSRYMQKECISSNLNVVGTVSPPINVEGHPTIPKTKKPLILFVGRICKEKGIDLIINTALTYPLSSYNFDLVLLGGSSSSIDPTHKEFLLGIKSLLKTAKSRCSIRMLGQVSTNEVEHYMKQAWVVVVPSQFPEPFGRVSVEAAMCGTPTVVSKLGGLPETFPTRVIEDYASPKAWSKVLTEFIRTKKPKPRSKFTAFPLEWSINKLEQHLISAIKNY